MKQKKKKFVFVSRIFTAAQLWSAKGSTGEPRQNVGKGFSPPNNKEDTILFYWFNSQWFSRTPENSKKDG